MNGNVSISQMDFLVEFKGTKRKISIEGEVSFGLLRNVLTTEFELDNEPFIVEEWDSEWADYIEARNLPPNKSRLRISKRPGRPESEPTIQQNQPSSVDESSVEANRYQLFLCSNIFIL